MSTRCVRYIQSCISPASQSVSQAHTPSRPFTCAHAAQRRAVGLRDAASVQGEGSGLLGPFSSTSDERGPSAQGPFTLSRTHTLTHIHTHTRASGDLRSVLVSLCCWRGPPLSSLPRITNVRRLRYSRRLGLVLLKRHARQF